MGVVNAEALTSKERENLEENLDKGFEEIFAVYEEFMTKQNNGEPFVFPPEHKQRIRDEFKAMEQQAPSQDFADE